MSEYQRLKARALELQREKEEELKRELARKAEREKQAAKDEADRRKRMEEASKQARRAELMKANEALHRSGQGDNGSGSNGYDPFAEVKRTEPVRVAAKPVKAAASGTKSANGGSRVTGASSSSKAGASGASKTTRNADGRKSSPPALGRKEKAALKLARASKSKASAADSIFSVRALVDQRDGSRSPGFASPRPPPPNRAPPSKLPPGGAARAATTPAKKPMGIAGMKKSVDVSSLRKLCPDRDSRDRRTIDEIQRDLKAKGKPSAPPTSASRPGAPRRDSASTGRAGDARRRPRSPSTSEDDSDDSDRAPRKRGRGSPPPNGEPSRQAVSAMIQSMFNRGRPARTYNDDYESDDMEAGLSDVEAEEHRALRIARYEDDQAEKEEEARKTAKAARLKKERERERERLSKIR
ncbi:hypothetical protein Q8F55_009052 [Vanrija albida]|uniref:Uncharacterized protein n=1 Tax=Vanrija albida TaxID=181172 RepID=A0ABR3PSU5_9TREE